MTLHNPADVTVLDEAPANGLLGVDGSIAYEIQEVETHLHSVGRCYGKDGDGFMVQDGLTVWQLTAGAGGAYGNWLQLDDGAGVTGCVYYDPHEILITQASAAGSKYYIQIGTGEVGAQDIAGISSIFVSATLRQGPSQVQCRRVLATDKLWARCKCDTDGATVSFIIQLHPYEG